MHEKALRQIVNEAKNPGPKKLKLEVSEADASLIVQMLSRRLHELEHKFRQYNELWEIGEADEEQQNRRLHYQEKAEEIKILVDYINDKINTL